MTTFASLQSADTPIMEAIHLQKYFPLRQIKLGGPQGVVHAVEDATFALQQGRALALVGESGSGKTTIARMLAQIYETPAGKLLYRGQPIKVKSERDLLAYHRHVQYIFQDPFSSLNPIHTVRYHLTRPLKVFGHAHTKQEQEEQALALLQRVSLTPADQFIEKYPHQLSGGQRQRVAIARALAAQPEILLADEPVSMLDVSIRLDILNLLKRLKNEEQLAFLFITHDIASARYFAEDTMVLYAGQMVEGGQSEAVIQTPKHPYTQLLIGAAPDPDRLKEKGERLTSTGRGEIPSLITPPTGCRFHPRCPHAMPVCRERFPAKTDLGSGHWVHCHLYGDSGNGALSSSAVADKEVSKV
ncbi:MAG TPA: ABC transporter ATP-binding protein [Ktedonobacterales bacterium]|nr:ABC transporter ATP-binding protein [Ktedonobacterales bacterium]